VKLKVLKVAKRRNKLEIIYDMLKSIQDKRGEIKPTHLLYKSNLSYKNLMLYVGELMENGLIEEKTDDGQKRYILTIKGIDYLVKYNEIRKFSDSFGL